MFQENKANVTSLLYSRKLKEGSEKLCTKLVMKISVFTDKNECQNESSVLKRSCNAKTSEILKIIYFSSFLSK